VRLQEGALVIDGRAIPLHRSPDISGLELKGVDVVLECTGRADAREMATRGLRAGARAVLISGPSKAADLTVVLGANEAELRGQKIVSNASCTTNALAPLVRLIDENWGVVTGSMTTIHCYTGSQPTIDAPAADYARSRAAALSMVPTSTSAAVLIDKILPDLAGRVKGCAVRVPTASVSAVDLTCQVAHPVEQEALIELLRQARPDILGMTDRPLVSSDLRARRESLVIAAPQVAVMGQDLLRIFGWYDNEWGFSARMFDVAAKIT